MAKELYIGHLPYEATADDLRRMFSVAGTVTSVHIITDPVSGKSKGCGYVRMSSDEELQEAINCLDGALMDNLVISVSIARPQKPQPAGRKPGGPRRSTAPRSGDTPRKPRPAAKPAASPKPDGPRSGDTPRKPRPATKPAASPKPDGPRPPVQGRRRPPAGRK